ncbi:hypothetical protein [uncultured Mediterranean phage uvDeep-CGR2-KM24-C165]|jgi:hypothetical protein|nr:hypothetical protein [uncultured Mediterranean phage uvDeep-CGR2-KM24-C165]
MPKIPTFTSKGTITSQGPSVTTNLQIPLTQTVGAALQPISKYVEQEYIKEKKLEENNKVDQLIADSYKDNKDGPVGFLTLSSETGKNANPSDASNLYDEGTNKLYNYLSSTKTDNFSRFGKQIFKSKFYASAAQLKSNALLESRKTQFKESSDVDNDFITQKTIALSSLPNGSGLDQLYEVIDQRLDSNPYYVEQPQLKKDVKQKYQQFSASAVANKMLLNQPSLLKKQLQEGKYNILESKDIIELSTKADVVIKEQKFSTLTNAISSVGVGEVPPNALKQITQQTISGNFAGDENLQNIYNSLTDIEKKEFRNFAGKKAREKRNELLFEISAEDAALKLETAEGFNKALADADVATGLNQKTIEDIFSNNLNLNTQLTDVNTKIINNAQEKITIQSDFDSNTAISALIATNKINNVSDKFLLPNETEAKSILERYGETDLNDLQYYSSLFVQQNKNPKQFLKTFAPFHSFIDETKSLISSDVIKILDPTSYNNSLTRFRDDMYLLYIQGISEGKSPLQLLDYKDKNFIGKDFLQYQTDKNKIFKNMMDNVEKKEVDESKKKLPGESPSEYLKRISE